MAKAFEVVAHDPAGCRKELDEFGQLLASKAELSERDDVLPFFRARRRLAALLGTYGSDVGRSPGVAFEFPLLGDFAADLVVGDRDRREYVVVEFEDGRNDSVFRKVRGRATTAWSPRFEGGFSQLVDWFYTLDDYKKTHKFVKEFGAGHVTFGGLLVVGRAAGVSESDRVRLDWRSNKVLVDSCPVRCVTFDGLHATLRDRLTYYPLVPPAG